MLSSSHYSSGMDANSHNQKVGEEILLQILGKRNTDVLSRRISSSQRRRTQIQDSISPMSSSSSNNSTRSRASTVKSRDSEGISKRSIEDVKDEEEVKDDPFLTSAVKRQKSMIEKFGEKFIGKDEACAKNDSSPNNMFELVRSMQSAQQKQNVMCPLLPSVEQRKTVSFMPTSTNN